MAPDRTTVHLGAGPATSGAGGGSSWLAATSGPTTCCSATSRSSSVRGSATLLPEHRRPTRRRGPRASRARAATPGRTRGLGPRRQQAEQHQGATRDRGPARRPAEAPSRCEPSARSSSSAPASDAHARGVPVLRGARAMLVGRSLGIGDTDTNLATVEKASRELRGYGPSLRGARATRDSTGRSRKREPGLVSSAATRHASGGRSGDGRGADETADDERPCTATATSGLGLVRDPDAPADMRRS